jgi:hypothetical protein
MPIPRSTYGQLHHRNLWFGHCSDLVSGMKPSYKWILTLDAIALDGTDLHTCLTVGVNFCGL